VWRRQGGAGRPRTMDESFDFGLERVLDGIELYINSPRL
jgi:hypothetical protein